MKSLTPRTFHARVVAKQILSLTISYILIFSSATTFTSATVRAQAVDRPEVPKLKISTGEAILRTTEPPIKNLPDLDEMKRKGKENDEAGKIHKVKTDAERLPQAVRCRPADTACQEYWKKQGKPSSNIGLLTPSETPTNSFTNLIAANKKPFDSFANLFSTSDIPSGVSLYRPPTTKHRPPPLAAAMVMQQPVALGGWQTEITQRRNETGSDSLFSGNYHWSVPIVGLPGRAGQDLGLALSYDSHVWVKTPGLMQLNGGDFLLGNPGAGFNIGLPVMDYALHYARSGATAYTLMMPSGKAIELIRRGGSTAIQIYESLDGSLLRMSVTTTDRRLYFPNGTRMMFTTNGQCLEIQDRNGNLITATYGSSGLSKITDTLGREINFTYNAYYQISDITQSRRDENNAAVTVTLAHFGYQDIPVRTNFTGVSSNFQAATVLMPLLKTVQLASGSVYSFEYNSYAQVRSIQHYAPLTTTSNPNNLSTDYRAVSTTSYNFPSITTAANNAPQTDCPRFTKRFDDAADWASGVTTNYLRSGNYGEVTAPNGTKTREYYNLATGPDPWNDGLIFKTELSDASQTIKRTTLTTWLGGGASTWGPVVSDATVTDNENNSSRYTQYQYGSYNLPIQSDTAKVVGATMTWLQRATTSYQVSSPYIVRLGATTGTWLVGLPTESISMAANDAAGTSFTTLSRTTYGYDQTATTATSSGVVSNHNSTDFSTTFNTRANVTSVTTWDTVNTANSITTTTKYNNTGAPIEQSLPDNNLTGRKNLISYTDSFSDTTPITNTFAYPTTVTDPDGNIATVKYRYDLGAVTKTYDPKMIAANLANGTDKGILKKYDQYGRPTRVINQFTTGYTRFTYDPSLLWANTFTSTQVVADPLVDDLPNELYNGTIFDGHGRPRATFTNHPGSVGGLRSQYSIYNNVGQTVQTSNPTEVNGSWLPVGDDAAGYVWSQQTYDYKGRPLVTTHQDNSTMTYEYGGCGCTGEATVTITDEVGRKTRRISDAFLDNAMQVDKTEVLNMNSTTVYSTTATVTKPLERKSYTLQAAGELLDYSACPAGNCNSATKQQTTTTFNGLGRVAQKQAPQQSGATPYSAYTYYADGSIQTSTDARGAVGTLQYNKRGLPTSTNYTVPSGIEVTPNVSYTYDSTGKRLTMTDGMGTANYTYDTLSRLTSESRTLTGLSGSFALSYEYYQATGQLKKITDPFNASISYAYDLAGRTTNVTGSAYGGVTNYATNISYRAWDGTKGLNSATTLSYDSSMRVTRYLGEGIDANYNYYADSQLYTVVNSNNHLLDRSFNYYDPKGRMNYTSANGVTTANQYYQNMTFTELGHLANRNGRYWWDATGTTFNSTSSYINNKLVSGGEGAQSVVTNYDVQGNLVNSTQGTNQTASIYYDSVGRATREGGTTQTKFYDGNGKVVKDFINSEGGDKYFLWSSVLGDVVTTLDGTGAKADTSVYSKGQLIAKQQIFQNIPQVKFFKRDPHNTIDMTDSEIKWVDPLNVTGKAATQTYISQYQQGVYGHPDPSYFTSNTGQFYPGGSGGVRPGQTKICMLNGKVESCDKVYFAISNGTVKIESVPAAGGLPDSAIKNGFTVGGLGYFFDKKSRNKWVTGEVNAPNGTTEVAGTLISENYYELVVENLPGLQGPYVKEPEPPPPPAPCITVNSILSATWNLNGKYYNPFSAAWNKSFVQPYRDRDGSERSFRETGGFLFFDKSDNNIKSYEVQGLGSYKHLWTGPDEFTALVNSFKREKKDMVFLMMYHTHPSGDLEPSSGFASDRDTIGRMGWEAENFGVGLIISGESNGKTHYDYGYRPYYDVGGSFRFNDPKANTCLPLNSVLNPIPLVPSGK